MIKVPTSETRRDETMSMSMSMKRENFHGTPGEQVFAHIYIRHKHGIQHETTVELNDSFSAIFRDQVRALRQRVAKRHSSEMMSCSIVKYVCDKRLGRNSSMHKISPNIMLERVGKKEESQTRPIHVCDDLQFMPEKFLFDITTASTLTMLDEGLDTSDCDHALLIQPNVCLISSDGQISTPMLDATKLLEWWGRPSWAWTRHESLLASGALFAMDLVTRLQSHVEVVAPDCILQLVVSGAQDVDTDLDVSLSTNILLFVPVPDGSMAAKLDPTLIDDETSASPNETVFTLSLKDSASIDNGENSATNVDFSNHAEEVATKDTPKEGEETGVNSDEAIPTSSPAIPKVKLDENGKKCEVGSDANEATDSCVLVEEKSSLSHADVRDGSTPHERENAAMQDSIASSEDPDTSNNHTSEESEETGVTFGDAIQTSSPLIPKVKLDENGKKREVGGDANEPADSCVLVEEKSSLSHADMRDGSTPDERKNAAMQDSIASSEDLDTSNNHTYIEGISESEIVGHGDEPAGQQGLAIDRGRTSDLEETRCGPDRMAVTLSPQGSTISNESSGDKLSEDLDRYNRLQPGQEEMERKAFSCSEGEVIEIEDLCSDSEAEESPPSEASRHSIDLRGNTIYDATESPPDDNLNTFPFQGEYSDAEIIALAASLNEGDNAVSKPDPWSDVGRLVTPRPIPKSSQIDSDGVDLTVLSQLPPSFRSEARLAMALQDKTMKRKQPKVDSRLCKWLATSGNTKKPPLPPRTIQQPAKRRKGTISDFFSNAS